MGLSALFSPLPPPCTGHSPGPRSRNIWRIRFQKPFVWIHDCTERGPERGARGPCRALHRPSQPRQRRILAPVLVHPARETAIPLTLLHAANHVACPPIRLADLFRHRDNKNTALQGELRACFFGFTVNASTRRRFTLVLVHGEHDLNCGTFFGSKRPKKASLLNIYVRLVSKLIVVL